MSIYMIQEWNDTELIFSGLVLDYYHCDVAGDVNKEASSPLNL